MKRMLTAAALGTATLVTGCSFFHRHEEPKTGRPIARAQSETPSQVSFQPEEKKDDLLKGYGKDCPQIKRDCIAECCKHLPSCYGDAVEFSQCLSRCMERHGCDH